MQHLRLLNSILDARQRRRYVLLQCIFLLAAVVQVAGMASIAPFVALVAKPELIHENAIVAAAYSMGGFSTDREFLIAFAGLLMLLVIISNAVPAAMAGLTWRFSQRLGAELQADIFHGYLYRDVALAARINSARMVRTVVHGISRFVYMVVQPLLALVSSIFIVLIVAVLLLVYNPVVALTAATIIGGGYLAVYRFTRSRVKKSGRISWEASRAKQQLIAEGLGGLRELRLSGTAHLYEQRLAAVTGSSLRAESRIGLLAELPRYALEAIAVCSLLMLGVVQLWTGIDPQRMVGVLSLYAMAGYKMLPAAQAIFRSASSILANVDVVAELQEDVLAGRRLRLLAHREVKEAWQHSEAAIEFRDVWYQYPMSEDAVVKGVTFRIPRRAITAIIGSSGAGKSTVADLLLGFLTPTAGDIRVGDRPISQAVHSWQRSVGYVSQTTFFTDDTIAANIAFGSPTAIDRDRVLAVARMANLDGFVGSLPGGFDYVIGEGGRLLSGGQRQRIGIARALYRDADVIVLDEPTSALDMITEREIMETLTQLRASKTIVMIAHRLSTLRWADEIVLLDEGRVMATGTFEAMRDGNAAFQALIAAGGEDWRPESSEERVAVGIDTRRSG